jgi:hypothetical protein
MYDRVPSTVGNTLRLAAPTITVAGIFEGAGTSTRAGSATLVVLVVRWGTVANGGRVNGTGGGGGVETVSLCPEQATAATNTSAQSGRR